MINDDRTADARYDAAIQDGRIGVYAISMAIIMKVGGVEYEGKAEWKYTGDGAGIDFKAKNLAWFEANCEMLDIEWDDESTEQELYGKDLTEIKALTEEFNFDLDVAREN